MRLSAGGNGVRLASTLFVVLVVVEPISSAAENVDDIVHRGLELRRQGHDDDALVEFRRALQLEKSPRNQAQVALAEQALGLWVLAESDLTEAMSQKNDPWIRKYLEALTDAMQTIQGHLGSLAVWGTPAGAEILVNEKAVGRLPMNKPIRVAGGAGVLRARAQGYADFVLTVRIPVGALIREHIELIPGIENSSGASPGGGGRENALVTSDHADTAQLRPEPSVRTGSGQDGFGTIRPVAWVAGGLAAVGVIFGTIEVFRAVSKSAEFEGHTVSDPANPGERLRDCGTSNLTASCRTIKDAYDQSVKFAIVGYAAGAALGLTSVVLFHLSSRNDSGVAQSLSCFPTSASHGVMCEMHF